MILHGMEKKCKMNYNDDHFTSEIMKLSRLIMDEFYKFFSASKLVRLWTVHYIYWHMFSPSAIQYLHI